MNWSGEAAANAGSSAVRRWREGNETPPASSVRTRLLWRRWSRCVERSASFSSRNLRTRTPLRQRDYGSKQMSVFAIHNTLASEKTHRHGRLRLHLLADRPDDRAKLADL